MGGVVLTPGEVGTRELGSENEQDLRSESPGCVDPTPWHSQFPKSCRPHLLSAPERWFHPGEHSKPPVRATLRGQRCCWASQSASTGGHPALSMSARDTFRDEPPTLLGGLRTVRQRSVARRPALVLVHRFGQQRLRLWPAVAHHRATGLSCRRSVLLLNH